MAAGIDATCTECDGSVYRVEVVDGVPDHEVWCHYLTDDDLKPPRGVDPDVQRWHVISPVGLTERPTVEEQMLADAGIAPE